jgi:hypothetical protein
MNCRSHPSNTHSASRRRKGLNMSWSVRSGFVVHTLNHRAPRSWVRVAPDLRVEWMQDKEYLNKVQRIRRVYLSFILACKILQRDKIVMTGKIKFNVFVFVFY